MNAQWNAPISDRFSSLCARVFCPAAAILESEKTLGTRLGTICLHSNVIPTGEEHTTKPKKVTITSSKKRKKQNEKETQTKESSRASRHPRMSAYFSLGAAVGSPLLFPVQESNPLQSPPSQLRALVPRSLLRNRTETLSTHSRNRLLVCSGITDRTDRAKIKQNKQTKKDGKDKEVTKVL